MALEAWQIKKNAEDILKRVEAAAEGRRVELCAACKTQSVDVILAAARGPIDIFGENRQNELSYNLSQGAYGGKPVDFIGHLQSRKAKDVVGSVRLIQSVDSLKLAAIIDKIAREKAIVQGCLVEINIGSEESKSGILPHELDELLHGCANLPNINIRGIMSIPPQSHDIGEIDRYFTRLYNLFIDTDTKKYDNVHMEILSMGMSGDFERAIKQGANLVRIGTSLFGPRNYGQIQP